MSILHHLRDITIYLQKKYVNTHDDEPSIRLLWYDSSVIIVNENEN